MPYIELIYDDCVCFFGNLENIFIGVIILKIVQDEYLLQNICLHTRSIIIYS